MQLDRPMTAEEVHEVDDPTGGVSLSDTDSDDAEAVKIGVRNQYLAL